MVAGVVLPTLACTRRGPLLRTLELAPQAVAFADVHELVRGVVGRRRNERGGVRESCSAERIEATFVDACELDDEGLEVRAHLSLVADALDVGVERSDTLRAVLCGT